MTSKRIIYVTGMKPKPDPAVHRPALRRVLAASLSRLDEAAGGWLFEREENFTLVSWTSLLYAERADITPDLAGIERLLADPVPGAEDRREADALSRNILRLLHLFGDSYPLVSGLIASSQLKLTLAEVRRYVDNTDGIAARIRQVLIDTVLEAFAADERVLLIGHSLGSVLAYDSLWLLSREMRHDGSVERLLTLGSPLATRFIRKGLLGAAREGPERYPSNIGRWINVAARGEMVALHRRLRPFFAGMVRLGLVEAIDDFPDIYNHFRANGLLNVHKSYGYLNHPVVARAVLDWLND